MCAATAASMSRVKFGRTSGGYRLRVEGKGTMRESRAAHDFAMACLGETERQVVADLSACDYLDSTFQGCLIILQRSFGNGADSRFSIANPSEKCRKLLAISHLDRFLNIRDECPEVIGEEVVLTPEALDSPDMARHIMDCHHRLAELGGPQQMAYQKIADQIAKDLNQRGGA